MLLASQDFKNEIVDDAQNLISALVKVDRSLVVNPRVLYAIPMAEM